MDDTENISQTSTDNMEAIKDALSNIDDIPDTIEINDDEEIPDQPLPAAPADAAEELLPADDGKPKRRRKGNDARTRIDRLAREKEMLRQELRYANELLQRQAEQASIEKQAFAQNAEINYENALNTQLTLAKQQLLIAEEEGDSQAKVQLQDKIADVRSQMRALELERKHANVYQDTVAPVVYDPTLNMRDEYYEQAAEPRNDAFEAWVDENQWFNPRSNYYNPKLAAEADEIADDLSAKLTLHKRGDIIGTDAFFETVTRVLNERHGIAPQPETRYMDRQPPNPRPHYSQQRPPVGASGGVGQDNQSMYNANGNPNYARPLYLTKTQAEAAKQMASVMGVSEAQAKKIYALRAQQYDGKR